LLEESGSGVVGSYSLNSIYMGKNMGSQFVW
jgi:hypothetical protein